jgi:hypothetical protein
MPADILEAFDEWFSKHNSSLAIPMTIVARAPGSIRLTFNGRVDAIEVIVLADEIVVTVQHEGHCWDILASFEVAPTGVADGVVCGLCDPSNRAVYPTRRALFVEHVFQPFAEWVERKLAPTRALGFGGSIGDGSTWAVLLSDKDCRGYSVVLPLWTP